MALLHQATIVPTKQELLADWVPQQEWYAGDGDLTVIGAYRFDDPADEVGVEGFLISFGDGPVLHAPVTYRGAALVGSEHWLIGTMEHSVLGTRWVYDALGDPVYTELVAAAILGEVRQSELVVRAEDGSTTRHEPTVIVTGSGLGDADPAELGRHVVVHRRLEVLDVMGESSQEPVLVATWDGGGPAVLAHL